MGRARAALLPALSECFNVPPLDGIRPITASKGTVGRYMVYHNSVYLCSVYEFAEGWTKLRAAQRKQKEEERLRREAGAVEPPLSCMAHRLALVRCKVMDHVFGHLVPGDLSSVVSAYRQHADMFQEEPGLMLASVQGKYWPWRVELHKAWMAQKAAELEWWSPGDKPINIRGMRVLSVVVEAAKSMEGIDYSSWAQHCGKKVSFHSGFLALLLRMGVVVLNRPEELTTTESRRWKPVHLSASSDAMHYLVPQVAKNSTAVGAFSRYCLAGDALQEVLDSPPRTCAEWAAKVDALLARLQEIKSLSMAGSHTYLTLWTFRAAAYGSMQVIQT